MFRIYVDVENTRVVSLSLTSDVCWEVIGECISQELKRLVEKLETEVLQEREFDCRVYVEGKGGKKDD